MSEASAQRQKRLRARQAAGLGVFRVEADVVALEEWLIAWGLLDEQDRDDRKQVAAALQQAIQVLAQYA